MSKDKIKNIVIAYYKDNMEYDLPISVDKTIEELKKEIEKKFDIQIKNKLKVKKGTRRNLILLADEKKTIGQCRIQNEDIIPISQEDVLGGY